MRRKLVCYFSDWSSAVVAISIFKFVSCRRRRTGIVTATVTESLLADTTAVGERKVKEIKQNMTYFSNSVIYYKIVLSSLDHQLYSKDT